MAARPRKRWSAWEPRRSGWRTWPHEPAVERAPDRSLPAHHAAGVSPAAYGGHGGLRVLRAQAAAPTRVPGGGRPRASPELSGESALHAGGARLDRQERSLQHGAGGILDTVPLHGRRARHARRDRLLSRRADPARDRPAPAGATGGDTPDQSPPFSDAD